MLPQVQAEVRAVTDTELRFSPSGVAVASFRAVANSRKKQDDGTWVDDKSCWLKVTAFKKLAENIAESVLKGQLVTVTGKLQTEEWEDKDGQKRSTTVLIADTIGLSLAFAPAQSLSVGTSSTPSAAPSAAPDSTPAQPDEPPF